MSSKLETIRQEIKSEGYELVHSDYIGEGSQGKVFLVRKGGQQYAIKQVPRIEYAEKEFYVLKELSHPNIIKVYDFFSKGSNNYIVMEYCQGSDLASKRNNGNIPKKTRIKYLRQIADGLSYLHLYKILYRDLKLNNVLLDEKDTIKLADFGISKHFNSVGCTYAGTPNYMAPEIDIKRMNSYDSSIDIWAFGCCIYQLETGQYLFMNQPTREEAKQKLDEQPFKLFDESLRDLALACLSLDPTKRIKVTQLAYILDQLDQNPDQVPFPNKFDLNNIDPNKSEPVSLNNQKSKFDESFGFQKSLPSLINSQIPREQSQLQTVEKKQDGPNQFYKKVNPEEEKIHEKKTQKLEVQKVSQNQDKNTAPSFKQVVKQTSNPIKRISNSLSRRFVGSCPNCGHPSLVKPGGIFNQHKLKCTDCEYKNY